MNNATPPNSSSEPASEEVVSELLVNQAREIHALSKELAKSYEKELTFFKNLESRDKQLKALEKKLTKKIWWLESERRELMEKTALLTERVEAVTADRDRIRNSRLGKVQRQIWRARKVMRSWR